MKRSNINVLLAICLIALAVVSRIANAGMQLHNYVPMAAIGLFSCAVIKDKRWLAFLVPLAGQFIADVYFQLFTSTPGFYSGEFMNYIALAGAASVGLLMKQPKAATSLAYVFGASTVFFIVSNFGYFI